MIARSRCPSCFTSCSQPLAPAARRGETIWSGTRRGILGGTAAGYGKARKGGRQVVRRRAGAKNVGQDALPACPLLVLEVDVVEAPDDKLKHGPAMGS